MRFGVEDETRNSMAVIVESLTAEKVFVDNIKMKCRWSQCSSSLLHPSCAVQASQAQPEHPVDDCLVAHVAVLGPLGHKDLLHEGPPPRLPLSKLVRKECLGKTFIQANKPEPQHGSGMIRYKFFTWMHNICHFIVKHPNSRKPV